MPATIGLSPRWRAWLLVITLGWMVGLFTAHTMHVDPQSRLAHAGQCPKCQVERDVVLGLPAPEPTLAPVAVPVSYAVSFPTLIVHLPYAPLELRPPGRAPPAKNC